MTSLVAQWSQEHLSAGRPRVFWSVWWHTPSCWWNVKLLPEGWWICGNKHSLEHDHSNMHCLLKCQAAQIWETFYQAFRWLRKPWCCLWSSSWLSAVDSVKHHFLHSHWCTCHPFGCKKASAVHREYFFIWEPRTTDLAVGHMFLSIASVCLLLTMTELHGVETL